MSTLVFWFLPKRVFYWHDGQAYVIFSANMEGNASSTNSSSQNLDTKKKSSIKWPFIFIGILVILTGVAFSFLIFTQSKKGKNEDSKNDAVAEKLEYSNPNGFAFKYAPEMELSESEQGVVVSGESEVVIEVGVLNDESLRDVVMSSVENSSRDREADPETVTVNSRTGYKVVGENAKFYYFPLVNDLYLEVTDKGQIDQESEILSTLQFTAPRASLN